MPSIKIDDDVQRALAEKALERRLDLFSIDTPNLVLRSLLSLNEQREWAPAPNPLASVPGPLPASSVSKAGAAGGAGAVLTGTGLSRLKIGSRLLRDHGLPCAKGYFSKTGVPYQKPNGFPAVFFDKDGYCILDNEEFMLSSPGINVGKRVSIPKGLNSLPGYVSCEHTHG